MTASESKVARGAQEDGIMDCPSTRDGEKCIRTTPHGPQDQHRGASNRRWYYSDDMQRGMPRRYIYDNRPLMEVVLEEGAIT